MQVPAAALVFRTAGPQVAVMGADGRVYLRHVSIARDDGGTVLLASGVKPGDRVVLNLSNEVTEGQKVSLSHDAIEPRFGDPLGNDHMLRDAMNPLRYFIVAALAAMISACAVGPDYHTPALTLPDAFDAMVKPAKGGRSSMTQPPGGAPSATRSSIRSSSARSPRIRTSRSPSTG